MYQSNPIYMMVSIKSESRDTAHRKLGGFLFMGCMLDDDKESCGMIS